MIARLGQAFCCIMLVWTAPALSAEAWNCKFKIMSDDAKNFYGVGKVQIAGDTLNWQPDPGRGATFPHTILQNNDVGIVAALSQAHMWKPMGQSGIVPLIGATVIVLDKSSGDLRIGSVMANSVNNLIEGHCQRTQDVPKSDLGH